MASGALRKILVASIAVAALSVVACHGARQQHRQFSAASAEAAASVASAAASGAADGRLFGRFRRGRLFGCVFGRFGRPAAASAMAPANK